MEIAIIENEYENIRAAFDAVNLLYFNNQLNIKNYVSSQSCGDYKDLLKYSCIFVDIDLSSKSELDGFEVINKLIEAGFNRNTIYILTGHINIKEKADEKGLGDLLVVTKPVVFTSLYKAIKS